MVRGHPIEYVGMHEIWQGIRYSPLLDIALPDSVKSKNAHGKDSSCNCDSTGTFDWDVALVTDRLVSALGREISVRREARSSLVSTRVWRALWRLI